MGKVDGLSRRQDWQKRIENNNQDQMLIKLEQIKRTEILMEKNELRKKIKKAQERNKKIVKEVEELKKTEMKILRDKKQIVEEEIVMKKGQIYIPKKELRGEVIHLYYNMLVGGHRGRQKTTELVTRNYWWPGVMKEVGKYVEKYDTCQQYKNRSEVPVGKLMPDTIPEKLWSHILTDFITKLPLAQGYNAILVVCDWFSKMAHFIATTEKTLAEGLVRLFRDHIQKLHELSESIISDRRMQFTAGMIKELNKLLGIQTKLSTVYYSQIDGQIERINQELEQYLRVFINYRQEQWPEWLGTAEFVYNNKIHSATKTSLFKVNYSQDPRMEFEERRKKKFEAAEKFVEKIKKIQKEAKTALGKAQKEIKRYVNRK